MGIQVVDSSDALVRWLKSSDAVAQYGFGRLSEPTTLTISTDPNVADDPARAGRFVPIVLPTPDRAALWWDELWSREVIDYWIFRDWGAMSVVVAANSAIWKPHDSLHAKLGAKDFDMIYDEQFRQLVGERVAEQMQGEAMLIGVSARVISLPGGNKGVRFT